VFCWGMRTDLPRWRCQPQNLNRISHGLFNAYMVPQNQGDYRNWQTPMLHQVLGDLCSTNDKNLSVLTCILHQHIHWIHGQRQLCQLAER
jgi:hypothetical protein